MKITAMDKVWASRIWAGVKTIEDAAKVGRSESVKYAMRCDVEENKPNCTAERYEELTGEPYVAD